MSAVFSQNLRRIDFQDFLKFVAVRSFTADSSLIEPTGSVNTTPHTRPFFTVKYMRTCMAQVWVRTHPI